ncbi:hypothetical protein BJ170DRAFT_595595 [Xylariales sp. AK1849]|nr:hypothetical protein BJ170DRAFT_595595 [Xylariales sp. AK1849]
MFQYTSFRVTFVMIEVFSSALSSASNAPPSDLPSGTTVVSHPRFPSFDKRQRGGVDHCCATREVQPPRLHGGSPHEQAQVSLFSLSRSATSILVSLSCLPINFIPPPLFAVMGSKTNNRIFGSTGFPNYSGKVLHAISSGARCRTWTCQQSSGREAEMRQPPDSTRGIQQSLSSCP